MIKYLILLKIRNMLDINVGLLQWFVDFLNKTSSSAVTRANKFAFKSENMLNQGKAGELHKPVIRNFKK